MLSHHVPFRNLVAFSSLKLHTVCALSSYLKRVENSLEPAIGWEGCTPDFLKRKHRCLFNGNSKFLIPLRTNDNLTPSKTANSSFHYSCQAIYTSCGLPSNFRNSYKACNFCPDDWNWPFKSCWAHSQNKVQVGMLPLPLHTETSAAC